MKTRRLLPALSCSVLALAAMAPSAFAEDDGDSPLIVGLGISSESSIYKDMPSETNPMIFAFGRKGNVWFAGTKIGYTAYENGGFSVSPLINLAGSEGYAPDDVENGSKLYDGLEEREGGLQYGVEAAYATDMGDFSIAYMQDSGDGSSIDLRFAKDFHPTDKLMVIPSVFASFRDQSFNQYYYGVDADQATADRPAYEAESGIDYGVDVTVAYQLSPKWHMFSRAAFNVYDSALENSPLVDGSSTTSLAIGVGYAF